MILVHSNINIMNYNSTKVYYLHEKLDLPSKTGLKRWIIYLD